MDLFPPVDQRAPIAAADLRVELAISLTQPWATLMAIGAKVNETRGWPAKYRGWIGIHAAKGFPVDCRSLSHCPPFVGALYHAGYKSWKDLPRGELLAVTRIVDCVRTEVILTELLGLPEEDFGDYSSGRFAFRTAGVRRLREPIPMKGALSIWKMPRVITEADLA